jgi:hypothetical protein
MRTVRFLPVVFLVGIDGFAMFAPYVCLLLSAAYVVRRMKPTDATPALVPVES